MKLIVSCRLYYYTDNVRIVNWFPHRKQEPLTSGTLPTIWTYTLGSIDVPLYELVRGRQDY